jgi:hypothetical protein
VFFVLILFSFLNCRLVFSFVVRPPIFCVCALGNLYFECLFSWHKFVSLEICLYKALSCKALQVRTVIRAYMESLHAGAL